MYYISANYKIYPQDRVVIAPNGDECQIRNKTLQLLLLLLKAKGAVVSKSAMLDAVWHDVVVDEQVIFQSIKELRKLFDEKGVIATIPREGYSWVPNIEEIDGSEGAARGGTERLAKSNKSKLTFGLIALGLLSMIVLNFESMTSSKPAVNGSIVILPVESEFQDTDHNWVHLGAMDQLIQRLMSTKKIGILQADYVLEVLKRAQAPVRGVSQNHIAQIFNVSGAALVVQISLSGTVREYQLVYSFHRSNGIEKGAVFDDTIAGAIDQVAAIIAVQLGQQESSLPNNYQAAFVNEMLANALLAMQEKRMDQAIALLKGVIATEQINVTAKRLLGALYLQNQRYLESKNILSKAALESESSNNVSEKIRSNFWLAVALIQTGDVISALEKLEIAEQSAKQSNDWLYLAHISEVHGKLSQANGEYDTAREAFNQAISYHRVLKCPYGESNGLLSLSRLAWDEGEPDIAFNIASQAQNIIDKRGLVLSQSEIRGWLRKIRTEVDR